MTNSPYPDIPHSEVQVPRYVIPACIAFSVVALAFLIWLIYVNPGSKTHDFGFLSGVNACLNAASTTCLLLGFKAIRKRDWQLHRNFMLGALLFSALFLVGYIIYHTFQGESLFLGQGIVRPIYFFILISHIVLSALCLPLILITTSYSLLRQFPTHKRWAKWTFPIWAYVSVTGVVIYFMLKIFGSTSA